MLFIQGYKFHERKVLTEHTSVQQFLAQNLDKKKTLHWIDGCANEWTDSSLLSHSDFYYNNLLLFVFLMQFHLSSRVKLNIHVIIFKVEWHFEKIFLIYLKVTWRETFIIIASCITDRHYHLSTVTWVARKSTVTTISPTCLNDSQRKSPSSWNDACPECAKHRDFYSARNKRLYPKLWPKLEQPRNLK